MPVNKKNEILTGVVMHMGQVIGDLEKKIESLELDKMKNSIVLTGLQVTGKRSQCMEQLESFFNEERQANVCVKDFYHTTKEKDSPIVIDFYDKRDKLMVMKNISMLSGLRNENDKPFFVNDHMPAALAEKKQIQKEIYRRAQDEEVLEQQKLEWSKGRLLVDKEIYAPQIHVPTNEEILSLSAKDMERIMNIPICQGKKLRNQTSDFIGYTLSMDSVQRVQEGYLKFKLLHGGARHIVCAYLIPDTQIVIAQGCCDDRENKAGRLLLRWMLDHELECRAFYVVRYYGGAKLGPNRFSSYIEAAEQALLTNPMNEITGTTQKLKVSTDPEPQRRRPRPPPRTSQSQRRGQHNIRGQIRCGQQMRRAGQYMNVRQKTGGRMPRGTKYGYMRFYEKAQWNHSTAQSEWGNEEPFSFRQPENVLDRNEWLAINNRNNQN